MERNNALSGWDASSVENISYLFYGAMSLTDISVLSDWDASSVTNMNNLFYAVTKVSDFSSVSGWDVSNVTNMDSMFKNDANITLLEPNTIIITSKNETFDGIPDTVQRPR